MLEFVMRPENQGRNGRSLGASFRCQLLKVYSEADVPSLPGIYSLDVLQAALQQPALAFTAPR